MDAFTDHFGSSVMRKPLSTLPLGGLLLFVLKSPKDAYLGKGDFSV